MRTPFIALALLAVLATPALAGGYGASAQSQVFAAPQAQAYVAPQAALADVGCSYGANVVQQDVYVPQQQVVTVQRQFVAQPVYVQRQVVQQQVIQRVPVVQQQVVTPYVQQQALANVGYGASAATFAPSGLAVQRAPLLRGRLFGSRGKTVAKSRSVVKTR